MGNGIRKRLRELDIEIDSDLGQSLIKLDKVYQDIEDIEKQIEYLTDKKEHLEEQTEVLEMMIMHKINSNGREYKWQSEK